MHLCCERRDSRGRWNLLQYWIERQFQLRLSMAAQIDPEDGVSIERPAEALRRLG